MKKGLIVFLVFALALVLILGFSGVFKKNGIPQTILTVTATNTEYVVKDDSGNIVPNKSEITIGHSYTITLYENEEYELKTFKINGTSLLTQLENNQYTFLCNGATNVTIISALIVPGGDVISNYTINYISLNHPSGSSMLGWAQQPDIDLLVYDAYENLIAQLDEGESFTPNQNQAYVIDAVFTNCTSTKAITYRFSHGGIWYPFPCNIENVSHNYDLHITYNFLGISFNSNMQADLINITDVGGSEVFDLTVGETYTINDITPDGYKVKLTQNGQELALPHTFVYSEDLMFEIEVVETATISVTSNVEGYAIHYAFVDNLYERTLVDETTELIVGGDYVFYVTPPSGYYLTTWGGTFGLTSEDYIPSTSGRGGVIEPGAIEFDLTFKPAVTPTINGENFTTTFTNAYGEETNILVLGQRYTATFTPNEGYQMYRITNENGSSIDFSQPYTFTAAEGMLFDVNCFEICEPIVDFNIPNASYVVRDAATHVAVSSPYVVGAEYEIYIFSNEGYVLGDIAFAGWQESTGVLSGSYTAVSSSQYLYLTATQTKLVISGTTLALITPTIVVYGPDDGVNFDELVTASYYYPSTSNRYYNASSLISTQDYVFRLSLSGEYEFSEIRVDGVVSNIDFSLVGNYYKSSGYIPFVAHEGILIEVYVVSLPLYATPELAVLVGGLYGDPYEGNFYDIGQILYYEPGTETYTTNPLIEHTYDIVIKINDDVLHSLSSGVTRFNNSRASVAETYYSPNRYVIGEKYSNVYVTRFLNIKFVIGNRPAITYTTPTFVGENFTAVITDTNGVEQTNLVVNGIYTIVFTANPEYKIEKVTYNNATVDITQPFEFRPKESTIFTVRTVQVTAGITPTITLSGYTGELSDVGSIKFRADTTSSNYITENLVVDTTYEATISTFSSSYYYISAVYVNGELVATNADSSTAMFTCQITATEDMEITLECTRK